VGCHSKFGLDDWLCSVTGQWEHATQDDAKTQKERTLIVMEHGALLAGLTAEYLATDYHDPGMSAMFPVA